MQQIRGRMLGMFPVFRALRADGGSVTMEFVTVLPAVLVMLLRGDAVKQILMDLVRTALSVAG